MPFVIDIDPVAFSLLGLDVRRYGIIVAAAAAVALWLAMREARRRGIAPESPLPWWRRGWSSPAWSRSRP